MKSPHHRMPAYSDLILPTIHAVIALGGTATTAQIKRSVLSTLSLPPALRKQKYRDGKSVIDDRVHWAYEYAYKMRALERPARGLYTVSPLGQLLASLPPDKATAHVKDLNGRVKYRQGRHGHPAGADQNAGTELEPSATHVFIPAADSAYTATYSARTMVKPRLHGTILNDFGQHASARGLRPSTQGVHPRDMTLCPPDRVDWVVEVKVVYDGYIDGAIFEAIGQLHVYRARHYARPQQVRMLAVFSEPIGDENVVNLDSMGIATVWRDGDSWHGSPMAMVAGIV